MIKLCDELTCTGCSACYNICPKGAIEMKENQEGFLNPTINHELCIECKKCIKVCPQINKINLLYPLKAYASWNKNKKVRIDSASGGIFTAIAEYILDLDGVVYGAAFDDKLELKHIAVYNKKDLLYLRDSKYIQSNVSVCFKEIKGYLDLGRYILFSGTACQISGLLTFLNKKYNNLFTVEILCHGVPSPKIFRDYIRFIKEKHNISRILKYKFRDKYISCECPNSLIEGIDKNGNKIIIRESNIFNKWIKLFLGNNIIRPACYNCYYVKKQRVSDFTIGDWFGYDSNKFFEGKEAKRGVSIVLCNTSKACNIIKKLDIALFEKEVENAINQKNEMKFKCSQPHTRKDFWLEYDYLSFCEIMERYIDKQKISQYTYLKHTKKHNIVIKIIILFLKIIKR